MNFLNGSLCFNFLVKPIDILYRDLEHRPVMILNTLVCGLLGSRFLNENFRVEGLQLLRTCILLLRLVNKEFLRNQLHLWTKEYWVAYRKAILLSYYRYRLAVTWYLIFEIVPKHNFFLDKYYYISKAISLRAIQ